MKYDLAISVAEEDVGVARTIHDALKKTDKTLNIYFYKDARNLTLDLEVESKQIYQYEAKHIVILLSDHYFKSQKKWTKQEFDATIQKTRILRGTYGNQYKFLILLNVSGFQMDNLEQYLIDWGYSEKEVTEILPLLENTIWHTWEGNNDKLAQRIYSLLKPKKSTRFIWGALMLLFFIGAFIWFLGEVNLPGAGLRNPKNAITDIGPPFINEEGDKNEEEGTIKSPPTKPDSTTYPPPDTSVDPPEESLPPQKNLKKRETPKYKLWVKYVPGIDSLLINGHKRSFNSGNRYKGQIEIDSGINTIEIYNNGKMRIRRDIIVKDNTCELECASPEDCLFLCDSHFK